MVQLIPPPDHRALLPPLLACLPTAFVSPRPPPALLPLLSPILRQRLQFLSPTHSPSDSWLSLLCWDDHKAQRLLEIVESDEFELHPASGEVEFEDVEPARYRRPDEETLQAKMMLRDLGLQAIYLWCSNDAEEGGDAWKLYELSVVDDRDSIGEWHPSMASAEEARASSIEVHAFRVADASDGTAHAASRADDLDDEDDDYYWRQYDRTPGNVDSPELPMSDSVGRKRTLPSDDEHYARYADVQPAMDNDEPAPEERVNTKNGLTAHDQSNGGPYRDETELHSNIMQRVAQDPLRPLQFPDQQSIEQNPPADLSRPHPSSSPSLQSNRVAHLEQYAESRNVAEIGIKQHIGTSVKSLFRLSRAVGMEREEFDRLVRTELEVLSLMETE